MILLDTNVISELMRPSPHPGVMAWLDDQFESHLFVPVIAKAEIELGIALLTDGKRKKALQRASDQIFAVFADRCLSFDCDTAAHYAQIVATARKDGRPMSVEDAQIAAISQQKGLALATRNLSDFNFLDVPNLINPWET